MGRIWALLLVMFGAGSASGADRPPNVILILADDLGYADVSLNGRKEWSTPNVDRLAKGGLSGQRFYTSATVCAPSRASLLTGKNTIHCGVSRNNDDLPANQVTIAEALKARGYETALFGKWHHGTPKDRNAEYVHPMDQGFDRFFGFTDATHAWEKFPTELWDGRAKKPSQGHADDLFTDRAVSLIGEKHAKPFFVYLSLISAHFNIEAPADEVSQHLGTFKDDDPKRPIRATYAAMVTRMDRNIGRVLDALDRAGIAKDTLVVFTSDHGATFETGNQGASVALDSNAPFRGGKRTLWEGGLRVPFAVRWPGHVAAGTTTSEVMQSIDLWPTIAAIAGAPSLPKDLDGRDLRPVWLEGKSLPERTLFWEWRSEGSNQLAAMRGDEKLVITNGGRPELFDVKNDTAERRTIAALRPERVKALNDELKAWLATEIEH